MGALDHWYTQTVQVKRLVTNNTTHTDSFSTVNTGLSCLIIELDANRHTAVAMGLYKVHRMYCKLSEDVQQDDTIYDPILNRTYIVKGTIRREQGIAVTHLESMLELTEGDN